MSISRYLYILFAILVASCGGKKPQELTPWGTPIGEQADTVASDFRLDDILSAGELIMLTLSGPDTYYDHHGHGMGLQYLLCEDFATRLGVQLRVEVCRDTAEVVRRLTQGEGDVAALMLPRPVRGLRFPGVADARGVAGWAVRGDNAELADTLRRWWRPQMVAATRKRMDYLLSPRSVTRHVYAPMMDRAGGVISRYDALFRKYAPQARVDWRLLAAQCYQESTFDPEARSWVGARGLMQIMPETADQLGLPRAQLHEPEANISAATRYISQLSRRFSDIADAGERTWFWLAAYNGGYHHIRDAMALCRKRGGNAHRWGDVAPWVLRLQQPAYYRDPAVRYGYMRGSETTDYVERIRQRWATYRGSASIGSFPGSFDGLQPREATRQHRFKI